MYQVWKARGVPASVTVSLRQYVLRKIVGAGSANMGKMHIKM